MDEVTEMITAQIAGEFGAINTERISRLGNSTPANMSSYDCYLKAVAYGVTLSPEDHTFARLCLEKALKSDQTYSNGWALLAIVYADDVLFGFNTVDGAADLALDTGHRAVQLGPKNQSAYFALAMAYMANGNRDGFVNSSVKAAGLNLNDGTLLASLGTHLVFAGEYETGKDLIDRGRDLNPHYYPWINLGVSDFLHHQGEYEKALSYVEKCLAEDPDNPGGLISHISLLGRLGRISEAQISIERFKNVWPDLAPNVDAFLGQYFFSDGEKIAKYLEGMREAGFTASDKVN
jgi:tetratricopeptide (TPR) repeat protein